MMDIPHEDYLKACRTTLYFQNKETGRLWRKECLAPYAHDGECSAIPPTSNTARTGWVVFSERGSTDG